MKIRLYTDAGVKDGLATWATIVVRPGEPPVEKSGRLRDETKCSTTAELRAIANALHSMIRAEALNRGDVVTIYTDSLHAVARIKGQYLKNLDGPPQKAALVIRKIAEVHGLTIKPVHVSGHKPDAHSTHAPFNNRCDKLCRQARDLPAKPKPTNARKALDVAKRLSGGAA